MSLLIVTEVVLRATVNSSTLIASEYSGYALVAMIYLGLGFSFREGAHIRINFLQDKLKPTVQQALNALLSVFAAIVTGIAIMAVWEMVRTSYRRGTVAYTVAETPLYIPQAIILAGLVILFLQLLAHVLNIIVSKGQASLPDEPPL
jgi:TRAP-type C4-dicarboxylate transport system permease small subunit